MIIPAIASILASAFLLNFGPIYSGIEKNSRLTNAFGEGGVVMGAIEKAVEIPRQINEKITLIHSLPLNKDRNQAPKRKVGLEAIELSAASGIIMDKETEIPLWEKGSQEIRSIASISKLMTALVFLDNNPGWEKIYEIKPEDKREGGRVYVNEGEKVRIKDLFYLSLVASANCATVSLVHSTGLSEEDFIKKMNEKARQIGLVKTNFADSVGLSRWNVSTAFEVAKLAKIAFLNQDIRQAVLSNGYEFKTIDGREVKADNTDQLLGTFPENGLNLLGGKTGYTDFAGYCFVGNFKNTEGEEIISVILGSNSLDNRFKETKELVEWAYGSYVW